jgi:hypothetical protein
VTRSNDELVDAFLADLGTAPVPGGLVRAVDDRIRGERQRRAMAWSPWLAAAAVVALLVVAGFALIIGGPGPSPTIVPSPTPIPSPTTGTAPGPTGVPAASGPWQITISPEDRDVPVALTVTDRSGTMTGVAQASRWPGGSDQRAFALQVGPGSDTRSITVSWIGSICDEQAGLELAADARTLALRFPPLGNCDTIGVGFRVELRFANPVDPSAFEGSWSRDLATPSPSPTAPLTGTWDVTLTGSGSDPVMTLRVDDRSGTIAGGAAATAAPPGLGSEGIDALVFARARDARHLLVGWTGGICDERAVLELAADGTTFTMSFPPRPACDAVAIGRTVELAFDHPVDSSMFTGSINSDLIGARDVTPTVVAFLTPNHGWVGGTTAAGDAIVLETVDGGHSWRVEGLGAGDVSDLGIVSETRSLAGRTCADAPASCQPRLYELDDSDRWSAISSSWPLRLSFTGRFGAGLFLAFQSPIDAAGNLVAGLALTDDGGRSWRTVPGPCPGDLRVRDVDRLDATSVVVVCESDGSFGGSTKRLYRSTDAGRTWTRLADGPADGNQVAMDLAPDGTGWMWGARTSLLATSDGGVSWFPLDVSDGDRRVTLDADAWGGGGGIALVWDADRQATLLLRTADGRTWTEQAAFPEGSGITGGG